MEVQTAEKWIHETKKHDIYNKVVCKGEILCSGNNTLIEKPVQLSSTCKIYKTSRKSAIYDELKHFSQFSISLCIVDKTGILENLWL